MDINALGGPCSGEKVNASAALHRPPFTGRCWKAKASAFIVATADQS